MAKNNWLFDLGGVDITNRVLSMNLSSGRSKYLDSYSGGNLTFTINNSNDFANSSMGYNQAIVLKTKSDNSEFYEWFWIREITFTDYPGNIGLNTATINCSDWLSVSGYANTSGKILGSATTAYQFGEFQDSRGGPLQSDLLVSSISSSTYCSGSTYSGSVLNYYNYLQATERGYLVSRINYLYPITRDALSTYSPGTITLGRTTSSTQIAYQSFERIRNGVQFINTATINPAGLTSQTASNFSIGSYGNSGFSQSTVDITETQALGNAQWIANNFNDPLSLRFTCTFSDVMQNSTALTSFMQQIYGGTNRLINFNYQVPGGSPTTVACVIEGYQINATTQSTQYVLYLSPLQYYQFFTLNSTVLGILNTSRLGW